MNEPNMALLRERMRREDACHKRARKYKILNGIVIGTLFGLSVICLFLPLFWLWRILLCLACFGAMLIFELLLQKNVTEILNYELDPPCYHTVINELQMKSKYGTEEMAALVAEGQLAQAVAFAENKIPQVKNKYIRESLRYDALRACFRMGDLERMKGILLDFERVFAEDDPQRTLFSLYGAYVSTMRSFLEGDYRSCMSYKGASLAKSGRLTPYAKLTLDYAHGVFCYYGGETEKAGGVFLKLQSEAPLTVEGRLSAAFLERMAKEEQGEEHTSLQEIFKNAFC